eukprot:jgi/Mesvir1/23780/Mv25226-RA.1
MPDHPESPGPVPARGETPAAEARTQTAGGEPAVRGGTTGAGGTGGGARRTVPSSGRGHSRETPTGPVAPDARALQLVKEINEETFNPRMFLRDYGKEGETLFERRHRRHNRMPSDLRADSILLRVAPGPLEQCRWYLRRNVGFKVETRTAVRNGVVTGTAWETHVRECPCNTCVTMVEASLAYPRLLLLLVPSSVRDLLRSRFPRYLPLEGALRGEKCQREGQYSLRMALDRIAEMDNEDQDSGSDGYESDDAPPHPPPRSPPRDPRPRDPPPLMGGPGLRPAMRYDAPPPATGWGLQSNRDRRPSQTATGWGGWSRPATRREPERPAPRRSPSPHSRSRSRSDSGAEERPTRRASPPPPSGPEDHQWKRTWAATLDLEREAAQRRRQETAVTTAARAEQQSRGELSGASPGGPPETDQQEPSFIVELEPRPRPDRAGPSSLRSAEGPSGPATSARHSSCSAEEHRGPTRAETPPRVVEGPRGVGTLVPAEPVVRLEALVAAVQSGQDLLQRLLVQQGRHADQSAATSVGYDAASRAPGSSYEEWSLGDFMRTVPGRVVRYGGPGPRTEKLCVVFEGPPSLQAPPGMHVPDSLPYFTLAPGVRWTAGPNNWEQLEMTFSPQIPVPLPQPSTPHLPFTVGHIRCGLARKTGGTGSTYYVDGVGHTVAPPKVAPVDGRTFLDKTVPDFAWTLKTTFDEDHVRTEVFKMGVDFFSVHRCGVVDKSALTLMFTRPQYLNRRVPGHVAPGHVGGALSGRPTEGVTLPGGLRARPALVSR